MDTTHSSSATNKASQRVARQKYYSKNADKCRQRCREWYSKNRNSQLEKYRERYRRNRLSEIERARSWQSRNKESVAEYSSQYRASKYSQFYQFINERKDRPCHDCGGTFLPCAMDFDHIRGEKVSNISAMKQLSFDKIELEIAKCDLVCSNCHRLRTYSRLKNPGRQRFSRLMIEYKSGKPCADCENSFEPCAMDFDHVAGEKLCNVSKMSAYSIKEIEAEIAKCELVCSNCHRVRSYNRLQSGKALRQYDPASRKRKSQLGEQIRQLLIADLLAAG